MRAPVIVFAYNRADHLEKTLTALRNNTLAKETEVYVFIDGPKTEKGAEATKHVIECIKPFEKDSFLSISKIVSEKNKGLAASVIGGVTNIITTHGKVIVLEDDAVSSPYYLEFMNQALDFYKDKENVWSIGGFTVPMKLPEEYKKDVVATQRVSSCAWATWKDRWDKIDWSDEPYKGFRFSIGKRSKFNAWGNDRAGMYDDQMNGRINSWAIRFDYAMFTNNAVNIIPRETLIKNIGMDGSGTHSSEESDSKYKSNLSKMEAWVMEEVSLIEDIRKEFCKPFHVSFFDRMKRFIGNLFYKKRK